MSVNIAKAYSEARDLQQQLQIRLQQNAAASGRMNTAVASIDPSNSLPVITMFNTTNGQAEGFQVAIIEFVPVLNNTPTLFGQPLSSGTPSDLVFAYELAATGYQIISQLDLETIMFQAVPIGNRWQIVEIPNLTAVTVANVDAQLAASGPTLELDNLYWPGSGSV